MCGLRLSVLLTLAAVLLTLSAVLLSGPTVPIRVPSPQDDMVVKHKWDAIPDNWLSLGPPLDDDTIDLHISLQPKNKNALVDALYEVSEPGHPKQVFFLYSSIQGLIACTALPFQIWRSPIKGAGRRTCCTTPRNARDRDFMAWTQRSSNLLHLTDTRRRLADCN